MHYASVPLIFHRFGERYVTKTTDNASINGRTFVNFYFIKLVIYLKSKVRGDGANNNWHLIGVIWIREQYRTPDACGSRSYIFR